MTDLSQIIITKDDKVSFNVPNIKTGEYKIGKGIGTCIIYVTEVHEDHMRVIFPFNPQTGMNEYTPALIKPQLFSTGVTDIFEFLGSEPQHCPYISDNLNKVNHTTASNKTKGC